MYLFILIVHIVVSLVLIAVILLQAGKGGGLAETFGGGGAQVTIFGQKASAFLTKATTVSAVLFLCTSLTLAVISSRRQKSLLENVKFVPAASGNKVAPTTAVPAQPQQIQPQQPQTVVKEVEVNPVTGEEKVVKEETLPVKQEAKD